MPELPEVEAVRRLLQRRVVGKAILEAFVAQDDLVLRGEAAERLSESLSGRRVRAASRKGKYFWLEMDSGPSLLAHLGMSGWVRELGGVSKCLISHGDAPLDDPNGVPRFLKLLLTTEDGGRVALTDGRRLSRIWLTDDPLRDSAVARLGGDWFDHPPQLADFAVRLLKRRAPVKALLLDQSFGAGIGNWVADECLYHARIAPARPADSLTRREATRLLGAIDEVLRVAVAAEADERKYPPTWMFHHRWGGSRGASRIGGKEIARESVGGRTTAWVPGVQK